MEDINVSQWHDHSWAATFTRLEPFAAETTANNVMNTVALNE